MNRNYFYYVSVVIAVFLYSCSKDGSEPQNQETEIYDYSEIIGSYVDNTIIPTYADMKNNAKLLSQSANALLSSGSQDDLNAACDYWVKTRAPWEAGESFLFGPAAFNNLDPLLDSWPLDQSQLDQVLSGNQELSVDFVRDGLGAVLRGFHTIEYLLFRDGQPRSVSDITQREKEYLASVSEVLRDDCIKLWALWDGGTDEQEILDALEIEIGTPYGEELKSAGKLGSRYNSQIDAVDEMLQGMIGIADEVANGKIADPFTSKNVLDVESWFSWNSLVDFQNNIRSIENSYLGGYNAETRGASLSAYVSDKDEALNAKVVAQIKTAITAIADIPEPFRNNLDNANVQKAMDEVNLLMEIIESEVRPLVVN